MEIYSVIVVEKNLVPKSQTKPFYIGTKEAPSGYVYIYIDGYWLSEDYSEGRQTLAKVTDWFFVYFLTIKFVYVAKLIFPTLHNLNQLLVALVNCISSQTC